MDGADCAKYCETKTLPADKVEARTEKPEPAPAEPEPREEEAAPEDGPSDDGAGE